VSTRPALIFSPLVRGRRIAASHASLRGGLRDPCVDLSCRGFFPQMRLVLGARGSPLFVAGGEVIVELIGSVRASYR
jgi:hypothetical protein